MKKRAGNEGNVLFLILIAVALFAGLTYVISNSTRSGAGSTDSEWIKMAKSQIDNTALTLNSAIQRHQFKAKCSLTEIMDNFCPPTSASCGAVVRPECNLVDAAVSDRAVLNWTGNTGAPLIKLSGGEQNNQVLFTFWGGAVLSSEINILLGAFSVEDSPIYMNFSAWRKLCFEINQKANLPEPDDIASMGASTKNELFFSNGMKGPICELDLGANPDKITFNYPLAQEGYN